MTRYPIVLAALLVATPAAAETAPAAAAAVAPVRSVVIHVPPGSARAGKPIELSAMLDAPLAETLVVRWRVPGAAKWAEVAFERSSAGGWYARLPAAVSPGIEYYVTGVGTDGVERAHFATAELPHLVRVEASVADRLAELDRKRIGEMRDRVSIDVDGHDFGNRYGILDRYIRAEAGFTHRVGGPLYEITFGFGLIQGATPRFDADPMSPHVDRGSRYGYAGVRMRATPSIYVDGRAGMGVSHAGFGANVQGAVTLGRPWRSNVSVGGEFISDLGPSVWVRLQWDTAPPLLMAASIVRTDLPGVLISQNGLYIKYEAIYRAFGRTTLRGSVSFGSRDGAAHFGGGLGAAIDF